jgi:hypothetical protein
MIYNILRIYRVVVIVVVLDDDDIIIIIIIIIIIPTISRRNKEIVETTDGSSYTNNYRSDWSNTKMLFDSLKTLDL